MDTPALPPSRTNHTLSSPTDIRVPQAPGPILAQWPWVWEDFTIQIHHCGDWGPWAWLLCTEAFNGNCACTFLNTPPPPVGSAEQLLPPGNQGQSSCSSQDKLGEEEMMGEPGRRWEWPQVPSPGVSVMSSPGSGRWLRCSQAAPCWLFLGSQHHWPCRTGQLPSSPRSWRPVPPWLHH